MKVHWLFWLKGSAIQLEPLMWHYPKLSFQVSRTSEVRTDSGTFQTNALEPQRCIQSNASAATTEDWHWKKGECSLQMSYTFVHIHQRQNEYQWLMTYCPCVADGSGHWARSAAKVNREQYQHQQCSTGHRAQRLHGVRLPARPVRSLPMCTTRQLWTNHLPSLRNQERSPKERKKRLKSQFLRRSRYTAVLTHWCFSCLAAYRWKNHMSLIVDLV